jgi:hypothetical protein
MRLPRGLYLLRGEVPLSDADIRANLRRQPAAAERLVLALFCTFGRLSGSEDVSDVWAVAADVVASRGLPASMLGVLVALAMLPEEGAVEPDEWALVVEAAP